MSGDYAELIRDRMQFRLDYLKAFNDANPEHQILKMPLKASRNRTFYRRIIVEGVFGDDSKNRELQIQSLRDAHQSLMATRMRIEDMPCFRSIRRSRICFFECWGGATFDAMYSFLRRRPMGQTEHPWKTFKRKHRCKCYYAGQNILGYRHYADDVVEKFDRKNQRENGIDIFRIFDALNDVRNLEASRMPEEDR